MVAVESFPSHVKFESVSFSRADEAARPLIDLLLADGVKVRVEEWV